jgi:hypothetical protein
VNVYDEPASFWRDYSCSGECYGRSSAEPGSKQVNKIRTDRKDSEETRAEKRISAAQRAQRQRREREKKEEADAIRWVLIRGIWHQAKEDK